MDILLLSLTAVISFMAGYILCALLVANKVSWLEQEINFYKEMILINEERLKEKEDRINKFKTLN